MILHLETLDDERADAYQHVGEHQWLRARDLFVAEGRLVVERLIGAGYDIQSVLVSPAALDALRAHLERLDNPVYVAPQALFNEIAGFNFHRGCLALARRPRPLHVKHLLASRVVLGLEGIGNPDNVGGLFRNAAAFGVDAILLDDASGDPFYRKAIRTSMGAVLRIPFARTPGWHAALDTMRQHGFRVVALVTDESAVPLEALRSHVPIDSPLLVLVGAEGAGLTAESRMRADLCVTIPMAAGVDSLNVTVAAGVMLSRIADALER